MEFVKNLPVISVGFKLAGVYRLQFDDGSFYIGCSVDLLGRSYGWGGIIKNPFGASADVVGGLVIAKIRSCFSVRMDVVEICGAEEAKDREAYYLNKYKSDPLLLSVAECQYKPVIQYKKDGSFVKRHDSITAAAKYNNTTLWRIQEVLNGARNYHRGMNFIYASDYDERRKVIIGARHSFGLPKKNKNIKVLQYSGDGSVLIDTHCTYAAAAKAVGCKSINIKRAIAGRQQTASGYKWALSD